MNKKILISLSIIAVVAIVAVGATVAYFSDTANMTGVTFSTGNADLKMTQVYMHNWINGDATATDLGVTFPSNIYPGYEGSWGHPDGVIYLGNFSLSPINLVVKAKLDNYTESNSSLGNTVQLAMAWGGTCDPGGVGTGFHTLNWWTSHSATLFTGSDASCGSIPNDHSGNYNGYARAVKFYVKVPASAGNEIAGSNASFNIHFDAEQMH